MGTPKGTPPDKFQVLAPKYRGPRAFQRNFFIMGKTKYFLLVSEMSQEYNLVPSAFNHKGTAFLVL